MDESNREEVLQWALRQTAYLDPPAGWQPDSDAARIRFHRRVQANDARGGWPSWQGWATAAAVSLAVILMLPPGRALAQQFWQYLTVRQVAFIRVNPWPEGVPSPQIRVIGIPIPPTAARDVEEARWRVHYEPRLPHAGVLSGSPRLSTTLSIAAGTTIRTADIELALRKAGVTDQAVPPQWDGVHLSLHTSSIVIAEWPDVVLAQSLPLTLSAPANFDFPAFSALMLRVLGVGPDEAQRLARRMGTAPPWLAPIARDFFQHAEMEEIVLDSGPATLLEEAGVHGSAPRITIVWSVPDRVYGLQGTVSKALAVAMANAVR